MAEIEVVTEWMELPPREVTTQVIISGHRAEAPLATAPQWLPGEPFDEPGPPLTSDNREVMWTTDTENATPHGLWEFEQNNDYEILYGSLWDGVYRSSAEATIGAFPIIDNDQNSPAARLALFADALAAWEDAHPFAYSTDVEWEGGTVTSPDHLFGTHTDRVLAVNHSWNEQSSFSTYYGEPAPDAPGLDPIPASTDLEAHTRGTATLVIPPGQVPPAPIAGTFTAGTVSWNTTPAQTFNISPRDALEGVSLGTMGNGSGSAVLEVPIDDSVFDAQAAYLEHGTTATRVTRGLVVWAVPAIDDMWRESEFFIARRDAVVTIRSTFTPPRFRISYRRETSPIRQNWARDDHLAGGAAQTFPPSKAMQSSNRTFGGGW